MTKGNLKEVKLHLEKDCVPRFHISASDGVRVHLARTHARGYSHNQLLVPRGILDPNYTRGRGSIEELISVPGKHSQLPILISPARIPKIVTLALCACK